MNAITSPLPPLLPVVPEIPTHRSGSSLPAPRYSRSELQRLLQSIEESYDRHCVGREGIPLSYSALVAAISQDVPSLNTAYDGDATRRSDITLASPLRSS